MGDYQGKDHRVRLTFATCNFSIILRGRGDFHRKDRLWAVQAPCVITQWPGEALDYGPFVPNETWDELFLIYDAQCLPWFRQRGFVDETRPVWPIHNMEGVQAQVDELRSLSRDPGRDPSADRVDRVCERLILETLLPGIHPHSDPGNQIIEPIIARFRRRPAAPYDLDEIARNQGMSASTLRRRWFEVTKTTPGRYLLNLRLQAAQRLLAETVLPVGEIAAQSGFPDMFYFSRRFKLETGLTPTQYRRRHRIYEAQPKR
jgi:AraC-like DNA-binding protein